MDEWEGTDEDIDLDDVEELRYDGDDYDQMRDDDSGAFSDMVKEAVINATSAESVVEQVEAAVEIVTEKSQYYRNNPERAWKDVGAFACYGMEKADVPDNRINWLAAFERSRRVN